MCLMQSTALSLSPLFRLFKHLFNQIVIFKFSFEKFLSLYLDLSFLRAPSMFSVLIIFVNLSICLNA